MNNYLIIANEAYIKYAKSLIYSLSLYGNGKNKIFLYLINPSDESLLFMTNNSGKYNTVINIIRNDLTTEKIPGKIYSEEAAFSANIRAEILIELINNNKLTNITYIDADSLIMSSYKRICPKNYDMAFFKRGEDTCSSGIISLRITEENKEIILDMLLYFNDKIKEYGIYKWFSDQAALKDVYYKYITSGLIKFSLISKELFDWKCHVGSKIWMGKGSRRRDGLQDYMNIQTLYENKF